MISSSYHADQFTILDFSLLIVIGFISSNHVLLKPPSNPHHLDMKTPSHLTTAVRKTS